MYQPTDLKKGVVCKLDDIPYRVVDYSQKVLGRGGSIVNVKLKNLLDGRVIAKTFKGQDKIEAAEISSINVQYLYNDGDKYYFMDPESFEQIEVNKMTIEDAIPYLIEGSNYTLQLIDSKVIKLELPKNIFLKVIYTEDIVKGDTSGSVQKDAKVETGLTVRVPSFIKIGDVISIDTSSNEYRERKK